MWNSLKQYMRTLNEQGRARFASLASDAERTTATVSTVGIGAASGFAILSSLYFLLYAILAILLLRDELGNPRLWLQIYYISLMFGLVQGSAIGTAFAWALALTWQGKRHKAALAALIGGGTILVLLALFQFQYYDPAFPPEKFVFWALLLFSPAYFTAACVTAWGVNMLSAEKA